MGTNEESMQAIYHYVANSLHDGVPSRQIEQKLVDGGLSAEAAETVVRDMKHAIANAHRQAGRKNMLYGALWCGGGLLVTVVTLAMADGGGKFFLAWGAILFGGVQFIRGAIQSANSD